MEAISSWTTVTVTSVAMETIHNPLQRKPKEPHAFKKIVGNDDDHYLQ